MASRKEAEDAAKDGAQTTLDPHLQERPPKETFVAYSDALFREAAIEWLVSTDQVRDFLFPSSSADSFDSSPSKPSSTRHSIR